jgi:glucan-binding YG repeat protein
MSAKSLEAQKIINGEYSNSEILLQRSDSENGYKIYRLQDLEQNTVYVTPCGNKIERFSKQQAIVNGSFRLRFLSTDNKFIEINVTNNKKSDGVFDEVEEVNMDEIEVDTLDNQEDLKLSDLQANSPNDEKKSPFSDIPPHEDDMKVLTNSKILESNPKEETTDGDWYASNTRLIEIGYLFQKKGKRMIQTNMYSIVECQQMSFE